MFYVNKIVGWILSPFGILFIGLASAYVLNRRGWRKTARGIAIGILSLLWILGCGVTTRLVGAPLERIDWKSGCNIDMDAIPEADAIVLLGGGMGAHEKCGAAEMYSSADRVWVAARLWKAGKSRTITISGPHASQSTKPLLEEFGVPGEACVSFEEARNTEEESKLIRERIGSRIILVTSAWHMPRAKMMFKRRGFDVTPAPADFEMSCAGEAELKLKDFFPSADALLRNSCAVKEWVGLLGYSILRR